MGLFDFLWKDVKCPKCRHPSAKQFFGNVRCRNPECASYYPLHSMSQHRSSATKRSPSPKPLKENFKLGTNLIEIRYRNFRGEEQTYRGDPSTLRRVNRHLSVRLAPTGKRVAFKLGSILNLSEVESAFPDPNANGPIPSSKEQKVMAFHKKRRSTSRLYEDLRRKYPKWESK